MTRPRALVSWSTGKDAAHALCVAREAGDLDVVGALTTLSEARDRVAMHDVPRSLLDRQLDALGLPGYFVELPWPCPNAEYEARTAAVLARAKTDGVTHVVFGDLFLEDVRAYRDAQVRALGLEPVYPLWGRDTARLAREMLASGLEAIVTCVDPAQLAPAFAGRRFDAALLDDLPAAVDPCGENGELHTFVTAAPVFRGRIEVDVAPPTERDAFVYADLSPTRS